MILGLIGGFLAAAVFLARRPALNQFRVLQISKIEAGDCVILSRGETIEVVDPHDYEPELWYR